MPQHGSCVHVALAEVVGLCEEAEVLHQSWVLSRRELREPVVRVAQHLDGIVGLLRPQSSIPEVKQDLRNHLLAIFGSVEDPECSLEMGHCLCKSVGHDIDLGQAEMRVTGLWRSGSEALQAESQVVLENPLSSPELNGLEIAVSQE